MTRLLQHHAHLFNSLYRKGILDDHFILNHNISGQEDPGFLKNLADIFYKESEKRLQDVNSELKKEEVNYRKIDEIVFGFNGSSTCFGAGRLVSTCNAFRACYNADNFEGCARCLKDLRNEYFLLKRRLVTFLRVEQRILATGGAIPIIQRPVNNEVIVKSKM